MAYRTTDAGNCALWQRKRVARPRRQCPAFDIRLLQRHSDYVVRNVVDDVLSYDELQPLHTFLEARRARTAETLPSEEDDITPILQ